jgi:hypothetical protein
MTVWVEHPLCSQVGVVMMQMLVLKVAVLGATIVGLVACSQQTPGPYTKFEGMPPDATVTMDEVQAAYIGNAGGGSGTLTYRGVSYPFTVAGIGVGGIGASTLDATGDVYNLPSVNLFPGSYAQGQYGFVIGTTSRGDLWLNNQAGVVMHLKGKREGLMLSLGGDAMIINMK